MNNSVVSKMREKFPQFCLLVDVWWERKATNTKFYQFLRIVVLKIFIVNNGSSMLNVNQVEK